MWYKTLKNPFRWIRENIFFTIGRDSFTDDPKDGVVQLRDEIVALVEDRINEIKGSTESNESYVLLNGPNKERYALARIYKERIIEYTYFQPGWPKDRQHTSCPASILPRPLVIKGNPFRIIREKDQPSQFILKVES